MSLTELIVMSSNIARDMLSSAGFFSTIGKAVVEYVSNGIDNPDGSGPVTVKISWRSYGATHTITVEDNGCGMDSDGLKRFFMMHAENEARRQGRRARGRFGTGKSAAFGIGTSLQIETVRNGRRWVVVLDREELDAASRDERPPAPRMLVAGQSTRRSNGTVITISGVQKRPKVESIANELRRRLGRQLDHHRVLVKDERIHLVEPASVRHWAFTSAEDDETSQQLGPDLALVVHQAGAQVDEAIRGVIVTAGETPVAQIAAAGDQADRLFGSCEVPVLDTDSSTPGPFSDARDLALNEDNPLASATARWVRRCLASVTLDLQHDERLRRQQARDAALKRAASKMESVLNRHYRGDFHRSHGTAGADSNASGGSGREAAESADGDLVVRHPVGAAGYDIEPRSELVPRDPSTATPPLQEDQPGPEHRPSQQSPLERDPLGDGRGIPVSSLADRRQRRSRGGFQIAYEHAGEEAQRAAYLPSQLAIVINLDHPLLKAVSGGGGDSAMFRVLAFNIAAEEYAQATANLLLEEEDLDAADALQYVRSTMDTLTRDVAEVVEDLQGETAAAS